jgi:hypothetical protein
MDKIRQNIVGFDINPLAVITARMNYLMALGDLLSKWGEGEIPIYLCDSICTPFSFENVDLVSGERLFVVHTSVGDFQIPQSVANKMKIDRLTSVIDDKAIRIFLVLIRVYQCRKLG